MPFIVFEGGEGVGKSTQMSLLAQNLGETGATVLSTREPGGTPLAECLRQIFKESVAERDHPTPWTELLMVAAARAQHLDKLIRPQRAAGTWILCDRFLDSALVYQGIRGSLGTAAVNDIHRPFVHEADSPDLTLILDLPPAVAAQRVEARPAQAEAPQADRLDVMGLDVHEQVRQGFRDLIGQGTPHPSGRVPKRVLIDASGSPEIVARAIETALKGAGLWPPDRSDRNVQSARN